MTVQELAKTCGISNGLVYRFAKKLGRLPTVEELNNRNRKKTGRKKKYI